MTATISLRLAELIRSWNIIDADQRQKLAEAERLYGADRETLETVTEAIVDTHADAARAEAMAVAAFPGAVTRGHCRKVRIRGEGRTR